jgi:glycosyltransferase involved in cell wall biosynthesis
LQPRAPLRVVQFCSNFRPGGGIQRHVMDLTRCLRAQGHFVLLAGEPGAGAEDEPAETFVALPLFRVSRPGGAVLPRVLWACVAAWRLRRVLRRERIALVHVHETAPALVARIATFGLGVPIAMTFHGAEPARTASVARIARACADLVISPSRATLQALVERGVPAARTRVMGLGVHPLAPVDDAAVRTKRRELLGAVGGDGDSSDAERGVLFVSLSRLDRQKGIDLMIEVARRVAAVRGDVVFAVAGGTGSHAAEVARWAAEAGVAERVRFLGVTREVALVLAAADGYLLTSRWEALPISIVEAFRAGRPVIATDCGGVRELVDETVGRLCPVEDVAALTAAVLELAGDAALRRRLGAAALARSREPRFDPAVVYTEFERVYAGLLD